MGNELFAWRRRGCQWQNARGFPGMVRRFRGIGKGRKTRRALERGGAGPAKRLNETLAGWSGVRITPMFGRWSYFVGETLFGCFPLREKERDLWVRLAEGDQARALTDPRIRPHRRFSKKGWVELDVESIEDLGRALRWLRRAHAAATRRPAASADIDL
jgi:Luciferase